MASSSFFSFQPRSATNCDYSSLLPVANNVSNESRSITKFITLLLASLASAVLFIIFSQTLTMVFFLGPQTPQVLLTSLSVSNLTVERTNLAANWVANLTFFNPNFASEFSFDHLESAVYYKQEDPLSITSVHGFGLGLKKQKQVEMSFATTGWEGDQPIVEYPVLREIFMDRNRGKLQFGLRISASGSYRTSFLQWTRRVDMDAYCLDLDVGFADVSTGSGSLIGAIPMSCPVLMVPVE